MSEEEEKEEEEGEEDNEEKEDNDEENEEEEKNEEDEDVENKSNAEEEEKNDDNKKEEKNDSAINKFLQSKLKPSSEIKLDLKSSESNNHFINKLNLSNHSILTAAFANSSQIPISPAHKLPIQLKSNLQIITDINNDMDLLSTKLKRNNIYPMRLNNEFNSFKNYNYDKEDFEIKKLINQANDMINTNYTTYSNYKNNSTLFNNKLHMNNYFHNSYNQKHKYFNTINYNKDFSIDSNENNFHGNRNYNTLPNLRNSHYPKENSRIYLSKRNDYSHNIHTHQMKNNYFNPSSENSLYSNDSNVIENDYHHSRNYHRKKFFNNENNFIRRNSKTKYYLTENGNNDSNRRKKPLMYIQPESSNFNYKNNQRKYFPTDNNSCNKYLVDRDNYKKNKKLFRRFNTENDNRAINILMGNE